MHTRLLTALLGALLIAGTITGCKGTAGSGTAYTITFPSRELAARITTDHFTVHETARTVLEDDFLYTITLERVDGRVGVIQAKTAKDNFVKVESQREADDLTRIIIYVGPFGDEAAEVDVFNKIEMRIEDGEGVTKIDPSK